MKNKQTKKNLKYVAKWKSCSEKAKFCMTPTIWHSDEIGHIHSAVHDYIMSGKDKTVETIKDQ